MTSRVLVLGGGSPLGRYVVAALASSDAHVVPTSRTGPGARVDVRDTTALRRMLREVQPTGVVYLPSPTPEETQDSALVAEMNEALRSAVVESAATGAETFVFASSAAVYGTEARSPRSEHDVASPAGVYGRFKLAGERIAADAASTSAMTVTSLRFFNLYGAGFHRSLINRLARSTSPPTLLLGAPFVRDYVHGSDAAQAVLAALRRGSDQPSWSINVGTGVGTGNDALAALARPGSFTTAESAHASYSVADPSRLERMLGVTTSIEVAAALRDSVTHGLTEE